MPEKCNKYESLFVFSSDDRLSEHLLECCDCSRENEKMKAVSAVAKEVAPCYKNYRVSSTYNAAVKAVAGLVVVVMAYFVISHGFWDNNINKYSISYSQSESVISEMGLPTDEYGLLMVY